MVVLVVVLVAEAVGIYSNRSNSYSCSSVGSSSSGGGSSSCCSRSSGSMQQCKL